MIGTTKLVALMRITISLEHVRIKQTALATRV